MCRKILVTLVVIGGLCCLPAQGQQKPHYTQYILNQYIINPAIGGIENYVDIKASHRHQWVGLQDAPVTTYFTMHGALGKPDYRTTATSLGMDGENPRGRNYWEEYTVPESHHGIGLQVIRDITGPLSSFSAYATYAYHLGLTPRTSLSAGFGVGMNRFSLDPTKLNFGDAVIDPAIYSSDVINKTRPDLMAGLYLYSADYFIGLSAQQIIPQKVDFSGGYIRENEGRTVPHVFATGGYRFLVGSDFNLTPSLMMKYIDPLPVQWEANMKLQYLDRAWLGAGYRWKDGFSGMAGLFVSSTFQVSYAYDYTTSRLNNFTKGTHELLLGFIIGNKFPDNCPRNVW